MSHLLTAHINFKKRKKKSMLIEKTCNLHLFKECIGHVIVFVGHNFIKFVHRQLAIRFVSYSGTNYSELFACNWIIRNCSAVIVEIHFNICSVLMLWVKQ